MSLMGIDIGTTGTKAVVFRENGDILASAYRAYDELFPRPGWVEMDPNQIWRAVVEVIRQVSSEVATDPIKAIGVSALGEAVTPIDKDFHPLYNTIPSVDARCKEQVEWWRNNVGVEEIYNITGQPLHTSYSINKILWLRQEMPEVFSKTWKFLLWEDLFCCWFGLEPIIDYSLASRTMIFDIHTREWSSQLLDKADLSSSLLAKPAPAGTAVGTVSAARAEELGIPAGVVVTVTGHDVINGAFGAGAIHNGQAVLTIGTTEAIVVSLDQPKMTHNLDRETYACYCHTAPEKYAALSYSTCSGNLLRWYRDNFGKEDIEAATRLGINVYDILTAKANLGKSGLMLLPHFIGSGTPWLDPESRGAILGISLATGPGDILAAILEGTTFELKMNLDSYANAGITVREMRAVGGGAKSDRWLQLKADITGIPIIRLDVTESGCLGAAIQAGVACGSYSSREEALAELVRLGRIFNPDFQTGKRYSEQYEAYRDLYNSTIPFSRILSKVK